MCKFFKKNKIEINVEKKYTCKVCGNDFDLLADNKYVVQEVKGISGITNGCKKFECFDCPKCGCQNVVNIREG